jgi:twitching motility two-component system response regulator PilH
MTVRTVLCVDDAPPDLLHMQKLLASASLQVLTASNGVDALALARSAKPDLIFLDIMMPGMDGYAVLRELKRDAQTSGIPVVFVSSKSAKADLAWAAMQGGKGYVTKPYPPETVFEEIKKF